MPLTDITKNKVEAAAPGPKPSMGHTRLSSFIGKWKVEGQQFESPIGPAGKILAEETFEWLAGEFFLIHRFSGRVGAAEAVCIEIIGFDADSKSYPTNTYYNNGIANQWRYHERDGTWILTGDWKLAGKSVKVRCTTVFGDNGNSRTQKWDYSSDGLSWEIFWNVASKKGK
jgi:Protein of unknown function (DUF1579)